MKRWLQDHQPRPQYLTAFEALRVEEVQDELLKKVGRPFVHLWFRPKFVIPELPLRASSNFYASTWTSPGYSFTDLFPIYGGEHHGFPDEDVGQQGWCPQMDGTVYASLDDARADWGKRYRGIPVVERLE
ncbi:MAG: hypothetical protein HY054_07275 [Proteobacteria bacterium]|nr:hypothetical protein [Pseudomonadota bacterium]